jgi:uncharacterized protein YraI
VDKTPASLWVMALSVGSSGCRAGASWCRSAAAQEIATWVAQNYPATTVGGVTVYDLTS